MNTKSDMTKPNVHPDLVDQINREHLIQTPLRQADLLFVFGGRDGVERRISVARQLWEKRLFQHAIVSGGMTPGDTRTECAVLKAGMVAAGIPEQIILEEHKATNTGENVIFSLPVIDAALGLHRVKSVICLGEACTSRRYPMTLHRHWPETDKMLVTVNVFDTPIERWQDDPAFRRRMLNECEKILPYKELGYIADWPPATA